MNATEVEAITLNALAGDDDMTTVPLAGASQNLIGGAQPITFREFEQVNVTNSLAIRAS